MKRALSLILSAWLLLGGAAVAEPLSLPAEVREGDVLVRAEAGLESLAAEVAARAPAHVEAIRSDLSGLPAPRNVEIRLVKRAEDMARAAPAGRGAPEWASGVAYPDLGVVVVATRSGAEPIDVHDVVVHELAHLAMGAALGGRSPRWLDEGFAYIHSSDWSLARVQTLAGMVWTGDVMPLYELEHGFPARESAVHRAYAQSYDFVAFLVRRGRYPDAHDDGDRWPFRQFLAEIAAGKAVDAAAWSAYGASLTELFGEWREDLRRRYLLVPASLVSLGAWALAAVLLVLAWLRRRRLGRRTMARWEQEEAVWEAAEGEPDSATGQDVPGRLLN